jgi:hypothetical protein
VWRRKGPRDTPDGDEDAVQLLVERIGPFEVDHPVVWAMHGGLLGPEEAAQRLVEGSAFDGEHAEMVRAIRAHEPGIPIPPATVRDVLADFERTTKIGVARVRIPENPPPFPNRSPTPPCTRPSRGPHALLGPGGPGRPARC